MSEWEKFVEACDNLFHAIADPFLEEVEKFINKAHEVLGWDSDD